MIICLILSACNEPAGKPTSSSRPYQVLLVGDRDGILRNELTDTVPSLPQPEPLFDVTTAKDNDKAPWQQLARSIVIVDVDNKKKKTELSMERNVYAKPQIVLKISSPSADSLREYIRKHKGYTARILNAFELGCQLRLLKASHNTQAGDDIRKQFGIEMLIPADMKASKKGRDFVWLSNNRNEGLQNICVYKVKADGRSFRHVRDSVMKMNIPGERDGMYMETAKVSPATSRPPLITGLWDMHGDIMGGPFVARYLQSGSYIIYIEGFVYAPEGKKRNMIRRLEACLCSAQKK